MKTALKKSTSSSSGASHGTSSGTTPGKGGAFLVAAGILLSRIMGLIRQKVFAHYFGSSDAGDAFYAALKIPNFLQNLFGDGVLSASFIPVYAKLLAQGEQKEADRVAGIIGSLLAILNAVLVLLGIAATPFLIDLIAPGFHGEKKELTIRLVQIFFPGTGLLVMSAWCLGILNSHRKFFLSYAAPVLWNLTIIAALVYYGSQLSQNSLAMNVAVAASIGSFFQFAIQWPKVRQCAPQMHPGLATQSKPVQTIFKNFLPVLISRGVVQLSAYIDSVLASLLPMGAVSALAYAQSLYLLPISLFGMSISAAELPAMSSVQGTPQEIRQQLRQRIEAALQQIAFFIVPSIVGLLLLGDIIVAGIYQGGQFTAQDTVYVWGVLAGSTLGLMSTTFGRLYSSAYYSLHNTRSPLNFALIRVLLTTVLGYFCGLHLPALLGISKAWGTAGLTASAGVAGWIEFLLLRRGLTQQIGPTHLAWSFQGKLWGAGLLAGGLGWMIKTWWAHYHPLLNLLMVVIPFGISYFILGSFLQVPQARRILKGKF